MREPKVEDQSGRDPDPQPAAWHVPVAIEDIAETGSHFDLAANADVRAIVAKLAGLRDLPRFEAAFDVTRHGGAGLHVVGRISATVGQTCVVTLEPLVNEVDEAIDLIFTPATAPSESATEQNVGDEKVDAPEPLVGGRVDLGALATEFLILGLDPYPRKSGAIFVPPEDVTPQDGPFAALAGLKKGQS
jgi:uncharacterized metal-binding protein YceD (DUF177 family)